jgi:hypothetical protein
MSAHIAPFEPASEVFARQLAQTLLSLAVEAGRAGASQEPFSSDETLDRLSVQVRLLVAAMSTSICQDGDDTSDIDVIASPTGSPPAHRRCRHSPPHCYDMDYNPLEDCP